ncbi:hypothetical protein E8E15_004805 [Penicillium rubens]|jgi:hypothetical protein|uniref:uncharacterized protein n=1 Tax=Penicillium rubens TaxID=1108849 RepID=UPI001D8759E2|nr:uncharacterized protein N7525_001226 [Penicillium rubens]KAF3017292.1 hypothetical protein E8E15_004805 [Penicillium rubens]KAJ5843485.1 hypothetical protein N7525_001226 [Penicillium rubens]KAJ5845930.1 hypothetical protein N7534_009599 [Penicillium rubens]
MDDIVGIIDWETSGWYPSYWEYTTAYQVNPQNSFWVNEIDKFLLPMPEELATECTRLAAYLFPRNDIRAQDIAVGLQGIERLFYPEYTVPSCLALPGRCTAQHFYQSIAILYLSDYHSNKQHAGGEKRGFTVLECPFGYPGL